MEGWIKLHRSMLKWEWMDKPETVALFIHILLSVNFVDKRWHGEVIHRGEMITSLNKLSEETGLTVRQVRTSLTRLISTQSVTKWISGSNHTIIKVCEYEKFQSDIDVDNGATSERQVSKKERNIPNSNYIYNARTRERLNVVSNSNPEKRIFAEKVRLKKV